MDSGKVHYMDKEDFDVEKLKKVMQSYSFALMGGRLDSKEEKEEMLSAIKEIDRELYDEYIEETETEIDLIGKKAYLNKLKTSTQLTGGWFWDGEYMYKESRNRVDCGVIFGFGYGTEIKFKPENDSVVEIRSNDWVDDNTKFRN